MSCLAYQLPRKENTLILVLVVQLKIQVRKE